MTDRVVVVGAGHAAGQLAARLRNEGFEGEVVLLGDEAVPPYQRPPLSKAYLAGEVELDRVLLRKLDFYSEQNIDLRLDTAVTGINRDARTVMTASGDSLEYAQLVLATGARVRELPIEGAGLGGVHYLRSVVDADAIAGDLGSSKRVVVIGGGYIGLEVAAIAAKAGAEVTVLEAQERILARVATEAIANYLTDVHKTHGVDVRTGVGVTRLVGDVTVSGVVLADGTELPADAVVIGVGVSPCTELASAAGLEVDDGIVVDATCATSDPSIFAIGDCTRHPSAIYGRNVRLESVHNAMSQARVAAANLAGKEASYNEIPWFWSDQYDLKLQIAGLADGYDATVVRGSPASGSFTVFALRDNVILAADSINAMREHMECRKLAAAAKAVDPSRLADPDIALKDL